MGSAMANPQRKKRRPRQAPTIAANEDDRDLLDQYLYEVSKTPLLKPDEEIALAKKVRAGDQEAMQELAKRNLRFAISVAKKYPNRAAPRPRPARPAEPLRRGLRREPTPEEISEATSLSLEVVQSLAALNTGEVRLDAPLDPDGDRALIERFIAEYFPVTVEETMA